MTRIRNAASGITLLALAAAMTSANAAPWEFTPAIDVTHTAGDGVFHHLESSGRRNIAVTDDYVAVAWEDNRSGAPQIYLAMKRHAAKGFVAEIKISSGGEAFEPSLAALDRDRFVVAWEQDAKIHARVVGSKQSGPVTVIGPAGSSQASLDYDAPYLTLVYSRPDGQRQRVWVQQLAVAGEALRTTQDCAVDLETPKEDQLYPTAVRVNDRIVVAWEDRRLGHTNIMGARSQDASSCQFTRPYRITEAQPRMSAKYGRGRGAARVAVARYAQGKVMAVWADKRDFLEGYDIYGADYQDDPSKLFGKNIKVQDDFGGVAHQWHPTVTGDGQGMPVVAWDDKRDGNANIMLSWRIGDRWSDDLTVPGASGPGEQAHPSIVIDQRRNLHIVWVERATVGGSTRLRYTLGRATGH